MYIRQVDWNSIYKSQSLDLIFGAKAPQYFIFSCEDDAIKFSRFEVGQQYGT